MNQVLHELKKANDAYRSGNPIMSDSEYDNLLSKLPKDHPYRNNIEPEQNTENMFRHPIKMRSTQKVKTNDDIKKWIFKVIKIANNLGIDLSQVYIRTTAKLDGMASKLYDDGKLVTRGNGDKGNIVTSCFDKGIINIFGNEGLGELVCDKRYFYQNLSNSIISDGFSHPRNFVVGIVMGDKVNHHARKALNNGVVHFVTYANIYSNETNIKDFSIVYREIEEDVRNNTIYPIDGVVIEVLNGRIKTAMGNTEHHNNWQCALKPADEEAITKINMISWQTGRTGKVTPVANVEATELDEAIVKRVTLHNARNVVNLKLGIGTEIGIVRSGGVIPKLENVISLSSDRNSIPLLCESCGEVLEWDKNNVELLCKNISCEAQTISRMLHFFKTIGNCDGFGPATIEKLVDNEYDTVSSVYDLSVFDFQGIDFGERTSYNLRQELSFSLTDSLEDWRFLAAFGVKNLGKGNCKNILQHYQIDEIFDMNEYDLMQIEGFAEISSNNIIKGLDKIEIEFWVLFPEFTLERTILLSEQVEVHSQVSGKHICFSGKMESNRERMQYYAKELGAIIQNGVNGKTDILVTGLRCSKSKIDKADANNAKVITEQEYYALIT